MILIYDGYASQMLYVKDLSLFKEFICTYVMIMIKEFTASGASHAPPNLGRDTRRKAQKPQLMTFD